MGCDCGCGGTCPICSRILGVMIPEHFATIQNTVKKLEYKRTKKKKKNVKK